MRVIVALILSLPNIGAYAMFAVGIVMIYRASKVLNLAHGAMAMIPAYVVYSLSQAGIPAAIAVVLGIVSGGALGWGVERVFVRRLRSQGVTAQTVGTVAALGLLIALASKIWGTTQLQAVRVFPDGYINISQSSIQYGFIGLFVVMLVVTGILMILFQQTDLGLLMRGTAENRRAAALMGVDPDRITSFAWILGGALAGLSGIMLASVSNLHPFTLSNQALPAFVAALLGGLGSISGAVLGAAAVGATWGIVPILGPIGQVEGGQQFFIFLVAIVVMVTRGRRIVAGEDVRAALGGSMARGVETKLPGARPAIIAGLLVFGLFPFVASFEILGSANLAAVYVVIAISLVLLTGWVGQISLGHAALVGVGAYATGWLVGGFGIPFPLNLPVAALVAAVVAAGLGVVAVRVRGLYLAVATLIFSWAADAFLFKNAWVTRHPLIDARSIGAEGTFPFFDFSGGPGTRRVFYFVAFAVAALTIFAAANLRDSKTGRALFAVRGSEMAASSLGIDVIKYKVLAFSVSGFMAGAAGNLVMTEARAITPANFEFNVSFFYLAIAVVGGVASLGGAVAAAILFGSLNVIFFRFRFLDGLQDLTSTGLLALVLLSYEGGLARMGAQLQAAIARSERLTGALAAADRGLAVFLEDVSWLWDRVRERGRERLVLAGLAVPQSALATAAEGAAPTMPGSDSEFQPPGPGRAAVLLTAVAQAVPVLSRVLPARSPAPITEVTVEPPARRRDGRSDGPVVLEAESVTVRFGGLVAVNDVSLEVREGEIVGLIGPNGAGKSVTFNSIAGIVTPTNGKVRLHGRDVTEIPVHLRAQMGVARTFQQIQLFPQLSVFDNLLVATHLHNSTGFLSHVFATDGALLEETRARSKVKEVVGLLDLEHVTEMRVADLPFGVLRMVEVARAMVTGFKFIMLDEPASGLDNSETERLTEVLFNIRDLGVTLLLIEHDVKMVTSMSDYMYVLERGTLIAQGPPDQVQRDPAVIAAYLGEPVEA